MGRRKLERKLLEASALGSLKKVKKILSRAGEVSTRRRSKDEQEETSSSSEEDRGSRSKKRKRERREENGRKEGSDSDDERKGKSIRKRKHKHKKDRSGSLDINCTDYDGWTPLHHAAHEGADAVVQYLLGLGARTDVVDSKGNTALHVAAQKGHSTVIASLRKAGADMERENSDGITPMDHVRSRLAGMKARAEAPTFEARLEDERQGWGIWGDETQDAREGGFGSRSAGWDWFGEEQAHRDGLSRGYDDDEAHPDDSWKDDVAEEMARRRQQEKQRAEDAFLENARREWADMKKKKEAKNRESQKILEEEQRKDREWRKSVHSGGFLRMRTEYESEWTAFSKSQNVGITLSEIPFPVRTGQEGTLKDVLLFGIAPADQRKRIREEVLRWHPDKFMQKFGKRLLEKEREAIGTRVKEVSQGIQDVYFSLSNPTPKEG